jgi:hypothetical protein
MVSIYQKQKGEIVYYYPSRKHSISYNDVGDDGKVKVKTNPVTGLPITNGNGEPVLVSKELESKPHMNRLNENGYWCVFVVDKNTPPMIAEKLKAQAEGPKSLLITEKEFIARYNPDLNRKLASDEAKDKEIADLNAKLAALEQRNRGNSGGVR